MGRVGVTTDLVKGLAAKKAIHASLGRALRAHGFERSPNDSYFRRRSDGVLIVADVARVAKFGYPGVASCVAFDLGLGTASEPADPRRTCMRHAAFLLGDGALVAGMCRVHRGIVEGWKGFGADAERVATLLSWSELDLWRNAPEVLWFRSSGDLETWAVFADLAIPRAVARLETARLDASGLSLALFFDAAGPQR